jgi:hypothetical protein
MPIPRFGNRFQKLFFLSEKSLPLIREHASGPSQALFFTCGVLLDAIVMRLAFVMLQYEFAPTLLGEFAFLFEICPCIIERICVGRVLYSSGINPKVPLQSFKEFQSNEAAGGFSERKMVLLTFGQLLDFFAVEEEKLGHAGGNQVSQEFIRMCTVQFVQRFAIPLDREAMSHTSIKFFPASFNPVGVPNSGLGVLELRAHGSERNLEQVTAFGTMDPICQIRFVFPHANPTSQSHLAVQTEAQRLQDRGLARSVLSADQDDRASFFVTDLRCEVQLVAVSEDSKILQNKAPK